jgi:hypothetical protein
LTLAHITLPTLDVEGTAAFFAYVFELRRVPAIAAVFSLTTLSDDCGMRSMVTSDAIATGAGGLEPAGQHATG